MNEQLKEPVRQVIALLVARKYAELETVTHGIQLKADDMATAVADYGKKLIQPPEDGFGLMNVVEVKNAAKGGGQSPCRSGRRKKADLI